MSDNAVAPQPDQAKSASPTMPAEEAPLGKLDGLELPAAADMHVHLREGDMTEIVVYAPSSLLLLHGEV